MQKKLSCASVLVVLCVAALFVFDAWWGGLWCAGSEVHCTSFAFSQNAEMKFNFGTDLKYNPPVRLRLCMLWRFNISFTAFIRTLYVCTHVYTECMYACIYWMYVHAKTIYVIRREVVKCHLLMVLQFNAATVNMYEHEHTNICTNMHKHTCTYIQTDMYSHVNTYVHRLKVHTWCIYLHTLPLAPLHCPYSRCSLDTLHCLRQSSSCHMDGSSQQVCVWCVRACVRAFVCACAHVSLCVCVVFWSTFTYCSEKDWPKAA